MSPSAQPSLTATQQRFLDLLAALSPDQVATIIAQVRETTPLPGKCNNSFVRSSLETSGPSVAKILLGFGDYLSRLSNNTGRDYQSYPRYILFPFSHINTR